MEPIIEEKKEEGIGHEVQAGATAEEPVEQVESVIEEPVAEELARQTVHAAEEIIIDELETQPEPAAQEPVAAETTAQPEPATEEPVAEESAEQPVAVAEESAAQPVAESVEGSDPVLDAVNGLSAKIDQLSAQFEAKIRHTTHEERIVTQMHSELQKYKEDMYSQLVRPILLDIIDIRDSIIRVSQVYAEKPSGEQMIPLKTFSDYSYDVQDILEKNNIEIYKSKEGEPFTPIRQRVVKKVSTPVEELHGKIAESLSDGYEYLGKTISPEKIAVYTYEAPEKKEGEQE